MMAYRLGIEDCVIGRKEEHYEDPTDSYHRHVDASTYVEFESNRVYRANDVVVTVQVSYFVHPRLQ
jgi:hypothetical protein